MRAPARAACTLFALVALCLVLVPSRAFAWVEWHHLGDSVRLTLGADGKALVETTSRYDVVRGPIKTFDVQGIDADAHVDPDLHVERLATAPLGNAQAPAPEGDADLRGHVEPLPRRPDAAFEGQAIRLVVEGDGGPKARAGAGLPRGAYAITWRYRIDAAAAAHWFTREGSRVRLVFQGTSAPEGYDSARLLVVTPTSAEPPRLAPLPWGATVAALRRGPGEDELELVRPHVARAEAPRFAVDLDARSLAMAPRPDLRPLAPPPPAPKTREHVTWVVLAAAFGAIAYWLTRAGPRGRFLRAPERAAGVALLGIASVAVEALTSFEWSLPLAPVIVALGLVRGAPEPRTWKPVLGALALVALVVVSQVAGGPCAGAGAAIRAIALVPALVALWPEDTQRVLDELARHATEKTCTLQVTVARHDPTGELRLSARPGAPLEGFVSLELGKTRAGFASLVRVLPGSPAEARLRSLWPKAVARAGRGGEQAYVLFAPTTRPGYLRRVLSLVTPAFGERRQAAAPVLTERRRDTPRAEAWTHAPVG